MLIICVLYANGARFYVDKNKHPEAEMSRLRMSEMPFVTEKIYCACSISTREA